MDKEKKEKSALRKVLVVAFIIMAVLLLGWHLIFPILGIAFVMTAAVWGVLLATMVLFAIATLLFYVFSSVGILVVCALSFMWIAGALFFFPFLFPLLVPLIIILFFVTFVRYRRSV